jgi:DNA replication protein DnaC
LSFRTWRYIPASGLANEMVEAADEKMLTKAIARYGRMGPLCIDELGYVQLDRHGAELLFQVLTDREANKAVAIVLTEPFSGRFTTLTDLRPCAAMVDRLAHVGAIIETGAASYLLAASQARWQNS